MCIGCVNVIVPSAAYEASFAQGIHCVKMFKYGAFSGPYFSAFGLNTERYEVSLRIQSKCGKIRTRKNSVFGHFSRKAYAFVVNLVSNILFYPIQYYLSFASWLTLSTPKCPILSLILDKLTTSSFLVELLGLLGLSSR